MNQNNIDVKKLYFDRYGYASFINHFEFNNSNGTTVIGFYNKGEKISPICMYKEQCILEMDYPNNSFKVIKNRYARNDVVFSISHFGNFVQRYIYASQSHR